MMTIKNGMQKHAKVLIVTNYDLPRGPIWIWTTLKIFYQEFVLWLTKGTDMDVSNGTFVCYHLQNGPHECEQQHFSILLVAKWTHIHMNNTFPYYDLQSGQTLIYFFQNAKMS
jgi:hypothetical protein